MYKVLLVDDEPRIREGLATLIEWEELGFVVADTAANGIEALDKAARIAPDLLIADIRMPEMNGLELVKALRERGADLHVLILSGYADFEYAKQAMTMRIDGYLLKPVDEDELIDYLRGLRKELDAEYEARRLDGRTREPDSEAAILATLAAGDEGGEAPAPPRAARDWTTSQIVLVKPYEPTDRETMAFARIKRRLAEKFEGDGRGLVFSIEPYIGLLLKDGMEGERDSRARYEEIRAACAEQGCDFAAASGTVVAGWQAIRDSYEDALQVMKHRFFLESGWIVPVSAVSSLGQKSRAEAEPFDGSAAAAKLALALGAAGPERLTELAKETEAALIASGAGEAEFKSEFVQLMAGVLDKLSVSHPELPSREFRARLLELYNENRIADFTAKISGMLTDLADSLDSAPADKQIAKMIDLIQRNYRDNLKLEKLGELFNYNSAYLGKLFKSATGESFNTYLDKIRIDRAKALLEQGMKVYQVAEQVGYASVDYFHSKFRKYEGVSPSAYKKK